MEDHIVVPPEPVQSLETTTEVNDELNIVEEIKPERSDEDIKQMARAVLVKKPGKPKAK